MDGKIGNSAIKAPHLETEASGEYAVFKLLEEGLMIHRSAHLYSRNSVKRSHDGNQVRV